MTTSMKYATTLDEQVEKLKNRGLVINDEGKAKEVLLDIGYYRFGAYLFPFEKKYPSKKNRDHIYKDGTNFLEALDLYYFDCDLRRLLMKYLTRIEVNIRTYITYHVSNLYKTKPCWFISHSVMKPSYVNSFYTTVYGTKAFQDNPTIIEHHKKYPMDRYAPAWKTVELMTIGNIQALYNNLKKPDVQADIPFITALLKSVSSKAILRPSVKQETCALMAMCYSIQNCLRDYHMDQPATCRNRITLTS